MTLLSAALLGPLALVPALPAGASAGSSGAVETVEGRLERLVVDTFDGRDIQLSVVVADDGGVTRVRTDDLVGAETGSVVAVETTAAALAVEAGAPVTDADGGVPALDVGVIAAPAEEGAEPSGDGAPVGLAAAIAPGTRTVHVGTAGIAGLVPSSAASYSADTLAAWLTGYVAPYWSDSTGGAVSFMTGQRRAFGDFTQWNAAQGCSSDNILRFLAWVGGQVGATGGNGAQHAMVSTQRVAACGFAGVAHLAQGGSGWINGTVNHPDHVFAHELGHTLTLEHSNTRVDCENGPDGPSSACRDAAYGDAYDVMGVVARGVPGLVSMAHLDQLGVAPGAVLDVTGPTTVTLGAVGSGAGVRGLRFATGTTTYVVEHRGATGRDTDLATVRAGCATGLASCDYRRFTPGVVVRRVDRGDGQTYLLETAPTSRDFSFDGGQAFTSADGSFSFTVLSVATDHAVVRVGPAPPVGPGAVFRAATPRRVLEPVQVGPGGTVTVPLTDAPAGATAVALNITAAGPSAVSFVSACASGTPLPQCTGTSALNPAPGTDTASAAIVALGADRAITLYNNLGTVTLLADLQGYYVGGTDVGGELVALPAPARAFSRVMGEGADTSVTLSGVPAGATAVALNVTTSGGTARTSFISVCPQGQALAECTRVSTVNTLGGRDRANAAVVQLGGPRTDQVRVYNNSGSVGIDLDVTGYFVDSAVAPATAGRYHAVTPQRVMPSRTLGPASTVFPALGNVPAGATVVATNLTATGASAVTYVSACPGGTAVPSCKSTSAFNPVPGTDTSNTALIGLASGGSNRFYLYNNVGTVNLIADVLGYFAPVEPAG
nr:hypothetical protein [uncultured Actinotalea sp.]